MQAQKNIRAWNAYEKTQLGRYKINIDSLPDDTTSPVEYLTGWVDFCAYSFKVTTDTLIPRPESEELVQRALEWISQQDNAKICRVIDVGTGCGAIALSLAQMVKRPINITASEISESALAIAKQNAELFNQISITWVVADLLSFLNPNEKVDLIIANLPYIPHERIDYLDASVKDFEPHIALDGGESGLSLIASLLNQAKNHLTKEGTILLEIDYTHADELRQQFCADWRIVTWQSQISLCTFAQLWPITNHEHQPMSSPRALGL
ncbi:peptide chain release factor N(5)-glutamine methyltransferase [Candidatus Woesebacteria bacterium]|nr:peptide chain release factor N(5)-glutamine methyltransferase [Candidatus Woesebacteria bacterium]